MKKYVIYPEVAGELTSGRNGDVIYKIMDWGGGDLIKIKDYLVAEALAGALASSGLAGFTLTAVNVRNATKTNLPQWHRLQVAQHVDAPDVCIDDERRLVVSERFYSFLSGFNTSGIEVQALDEAATLEERQASIFQAMKQLSSKGCDKGS